MFGCKHNPTTRVFSGKDLQENKIQYVVCLDGGRNLLYNWDVMKIGKPVKILP